MHLSHSSLEHTIDQLQLVRTSHQYRKVTGSNPVEVLTKLLKKGQPRELYPVSWLSRSPSKIWSFSGFRWVSHPFLLISFWSNRKGPKIKKPRESIIFAGFVSQKNYSIVTYDWLDLRCKSPPRGLFSDHHNDKYELGVILLLVRGSFLKGIFIKMFTATKTKSAYFGVFTCLLLLRYWMSHVRQK